MATFCNFRTSITTKYYIMQTATINFLDLFEINKIYDLHTKDVCKMFKDITEALTLNPKCEKMAVILKTDANYTDEDLMTRVFVDVIIISQDNPNDRWSAQWYIYRAKKLLVSKLRFKPYKTYYKRTIIKFTLHLATFRVRCISYFKQ